MKQNREQGEERPASGEASYDNGRRLQERSPDRDPSEASLRFFSFGRLASRLIASSLPGRGNSPGAAPPPWRHERYFDGFLADTGPVMITGYWAALYALAVGAPASPAMLTAGPSPEV